jgi:hypothetical protein
MNTNDRTNGALNRAILAYRENPTPENRAALLAAQSAHVNHFYAEQAAEFVRRTS